MALALALVAGGLMSWWLAAEAWAASSALVARGLRGTNDLPDLVAIPLVWVGAAVAAWYALTSLAGLGLRVIARTSTHHPRALHADAGARPHTARLARFIGRFGAPAIRRVALTGVTAGLSVSMAILPASAVPGDTDPDDAGASDSLVAPPLRQSDLPGIPALPGFELTGHRSLIEVRITEGAADPGGQGTGGTGARDTGEADAAGPGGSESAEGADRTDAEGAGEGGSAVGSPAPQDQGPAPRTHEPASQDQQPSSQDPGAPTSPPDQQGTQGTPGTEQTDQVRSDPVFSDPEAPARSTPAPATPPTSTDPASTPPGPPTGGSTTDAAATGTPPADEPSATYVVAPGDSLWEIAAAHAEPAAGPADIAAAWPQWYAANRDAIGLDPDLVLPGTVLAIPEPAATTTTGGTR
ncbi:hypothetical protein CZ771_05270 [Actinomycetales bacterium JB111]|nr:hypothetical protein CZ771_05270 [Actinomycetales bacterium JB111]